MNNINERIRELREYLKLSRNDFGERLGLSGDSINNLERGRVVIKDFIIKLISQEFNVDENWLRTGEGSMFTLELDEDTVLVEQLLNEYDNPLFSEIKSLVFNIMKVYNQLDPKSQQVIDDFIIKLKNEQNNNKND